VITWRLLIIVVRSVLASYYYILSFFYFDFIFIFYYFYYIFISRARSADSKVWNVAKVPGQDVSAKVYVSTKDSTLLKMEVAKQGMSTNEEILGVLMCVFVHVALISFILFSYSLLVCSHVGQVPIIVELTQVATGPIPAFRWLEIPGCSNAPRNSANAAEVTRGSHVSVEKNGRHLPDHVNDLFAYLVARVSQKGHANDNAF
jgi:hypothetical protein